MVTFYMVKMDVSTKNAAKYYFFLFFYLDIGGVEEDELVENFFETVEVIGGECNNNSLVEWTLVGLDSVFGRELREQVEVEGFVCQNGKREGVVFLHVHFLIHHRCILTGHIVCVKQKRSRTYIFIVNDLNGLELSV